MPLGCEGGLQGYLPNGYWKAYVYHYSSERGIPGAIVNNVWRNNGERLWDRNSFVQMCSIKQDITRKYGIKVNAKYAFDYTHYMNNGDKRCGSTTSINNERFMSR